MTHLNAHKVFSKKIIKEIWKYYFGRYPWVSNQDYEGHNKKICGLHRQGESVRNIAKKINVTQKIRLRLSTKLGYLELEL